MMRNDRRIRLIMWIMKLAESRPDDDMFHKAEVFRTDAFRQASPRDKELMMFESSEKRYQHAIKYLFSSYFKMDLKPFLKGKTVLDFGCFTGGRSVAWAQRYEVADMHGVDINEVYVNAAKHYAKVKKVPATFNLSDGRTLPYLDETFDSILSYDVFEHVSDVEQTLKECRRCIKIRGKLFVVFPSYYHPVGPHLSFATRVPCLHYFFCGKDILQAYNRVIQERGEKTYWYKRPHPGLRPWEKCHNVNGMTKRKFYKLAQKFGFRIYSESHIPLLRIGQISSKKPALKIFGWMLTPFAKLPFLEEILCNRVACVLEKI